MRSYGIGGIVEVNFQDINGAQYTSIAKGFDASTTFESVALYVNADANNGTHAFDLSSNNYVGTYVDSTSTTQSNFGSAFVFDGSSDYVTFSTDVIDRTQPFTIALWFNASSAFSGTTYTFALRDATPTEYLALTVTDSGGGKLKISTNGESAGNDDVTLSTNVWYHVALIYDGTSLISYLDGEEAYSVIPSGSGWQSGAIDTFYIGRKGDSGGNDWAGQIDEVMMFSKGLTGQEISNLYNVGR